MTSRIKTIVFLGLLTAATIQVQASAKSPLADNAALFYWRAFASLPKLDDKQDQAMLKFLEKAGPVTDEIAGIVQSGDAAFRELYRGAAQANCDWGVALDDGPEALLPHLGEARKLGRLACLRARVRFEQGKDKEAIEDLAAVMTLARHAGSDGLLISVLVQIAIESSAVEQAAGYLPTMNPQARVLLAERLARLPQSKTMADGMRMEKEALLEWVIRKLGQPDGRQQVMALFPEPADPNAALLRKLTDAELRTSAEQLRGVYDHIIAWMALPPDEIESKSGMLADQPGLNAAAKQLGGLLLPATIPARCSEAVYQTRLRMLSAGLAFVANGPDVLKQDQYSDPFGKGPFECIRTDGGFQLKSKLADRQQKPVTLNFGSKD